MTSAAVPAVQHCNTAVARRQPGMLQRLMLQWRVVWQVLCGCRMNASSAKSHLVHGNASMVGLLWWGFLVSLLATLAVAVVRTSTETSKGVVPACYPCCCSAAARHTRLAYRTSAFLHL
jgi:hypothetical protein